MSARDTSFGSRQSGTSEMSGAGVEPLGLLDPASLDDPTPTTTPLRTIPSLPKLSQTQALILSLGGAQQ